MLFRKSLPKKADIFTSYKKTKHHYFHGTPFKPLQVVGILIIGFLMLFDALILFPAKASSIKENENANSYTLNNRNNNSWVKPYNNL